jgi:PEGA domain
MTGRASRWFAVTAALACASPVFAQGSPDQPSSPGLRGALRGDALAAYDAAKLLFEDGDAAGALTKFRRAFELSKDARLLWNMAVCEKEMRHYAGAARLVNQYLSQADSRISEGSRKDAQATLSALRGFYSELTLVGAPSGARISVDGVYAATAPLTEPLPIDLGERQLSIDAAGYEPLQKRLEVPGAVPVTLSVELVRRSEKATLAVTTEPRNIISIDGKVVGSAAWRGALPAGTHVVRVTADGKKPYNSELRLGAGSNRALDVVLQDQAGARPVWPWIAGAAVVLVGAGIGTYFVVKPGEPDPGPNGGLGRVYLPLGL